MRLGRPPSTVRGWLRAGARRAEMLRAAALRWTQALNLARGPAGSPLADAVEAIGSAVRECRLQLGIRAGPWELAVALTGACCATERRATHWASDAASEHPSAMDAAP
jgi:hypothetical protein